MYMLQTRLPMQQLKKLDKDLHSISEFLHSRELKLNLANTPFLVLRKPTVQHLWVAILCHCGWTIILCWVSWHHYWWALDIPSASWCTLKGGQCKIEWMSALPHHVDQSSQAHILPVYVQSTLEYASNTVCDNMKRQWWWGLGTSSDRWCRSQH